MKFEKITSYPPLPTAKDAEQEKYARDAARYLGKFHEDLASVKMVGDTDDANCDLAAEIKEYEQDWAAMADAYAVHDHAAADKARAKIKQKLTSVQAVFDRAKP